MPPHSVTHPDHGLAGGREANPPPIVLLPLRRDRQAWVGALLRRQRQLLLYAAIGSTALVVDLGLFLGLTTGLGLSPLLAHGISVPVAAVFSFTLNARYNFRRTDQWRTRMASFASVVGTGYVVGALVIWLIANVAGGPGLTAKLISLPVVFALQYTLNSRITFHPERIGAQ